MPEEGYQGSELEFSGHSDRVEDHLLRLAARDGFPMVNPPFIPKTHAALSLAELGRDAGEEAHRELHAAIFAAHFGQGKDIGSRDVLLEIGTERGYHAEEIEDVWESDRYGERLHQFRHVALHLGVDATPAALICNELLIGSRPYQVFKDAVDRCLVTPADVESDEGDI
jgi:predicted DsbA family dithiol-disulfide isomerase